MLHGFMCFRVISQVQYNGCNKLSEMCFTTIKESLVSLFALQVRSVKDL